MLQLIRFYLVVLCFSSFGIVSNVANAANEKIKNIRVWHSPDRSRIEFDLSNDEIKANEIFGHRVVVDLTDKSAAVPNTSTPADNKPVVSTEPLAPAVPVQPFETIASPAFKREIVVAIDAGHGGADPGAIGYRKSREKDITLAISKKLKAVIDKNPSMKAVMIRKGDYFVELHKRRLNARNVNADIFLSIHADAFTKQSARGFSVFATCFKRVIKAR